MATKAANKISVKTVYGAIPKSALYGKDAPADGRLPIMRVVGIANDIKTGSGDNGPWTAFIGQFAATNLATGEITRSGKCFLPNGATDMVIGALNMEGVKGVEFAFDLVAVVDESTAVGYHYDVVSLVEPSADDPVSKLLASVATVELPKLAAPKPAEPASGAESGEGGKVKK